MDPTSASVDPRVLQAATLSSAAAVRVWRLSGLSVLFLVAVAGLAYGSFADAINVLWKGWQLQPEYSHGVLIPLIVAFLIWQQRDRLQRLPFTGSWWGVVCVAAAAGLWYLGELASVYALVQYAFVLSIAGVVLALVGREGFALLRTPLLLLLLMIPFPAFFTNSLSLQLQLLSSQLGVWFIRLFGISVLVEGNVVDLGVYKLQVAEACDGLRYLFPLLTIGFIMAYFYRAAMWKRVAVFLSSIPLTILMNSLRIGVIGVLVEYWGIGMAEGFLHQFQGWLVFMATVALMLGEIALLSLVGRAPADSRQIFRIELPAPTPAGAVIERRVLPLSLIIAAAVLAAQFGASLLLPQRQEIVPSRAAFTSFPSAVLSRKAQPLAMEEVYQQALNMDDYLLADYVGADRSAVNLYIAYYGSQRKGQSVHSPRSCLPGGGWQMRVFGQRELPGIRYNGQPVRVNRAVIELGNQRSLVYYWFVQRGRIITNEYAVKWYLFWDSLTRQRTDGALVRLGMPLPSTASMAHADEELTAFAAAISPVLPQFVRN